MSANITEEASRLRASAASSIIQNELDLKEIEREFAGFKIESTASDELSDKELKRLLVAEERVTKLLQQVSSNTPILCSAIAASIVPSNTSAQITPIISELDMANGYLKEAEAKLSEFEDTSGFIEQKNILVTAQDKINKTLVELKNAINQSHLLIFG